MKWIVDFLMGGAKPKPQPVWKYIGYVPVGLTRKDALNKTNQGFIVKILLYMTDDGQRKYEHMGDKGAVAFIETTCTEFFDTKAWIAGAGFPGKFVPENDVLGEMLSKLIDDRLLGKEDKP